MSNGIVWRAIHQRVISQNSKAMTTTPSHSVHSSLVEDAQAIFRAAVRGVQADELLANTEPSQWANRPLDAYNRIRIVGMGKAAMALAGVVEERLAEHSVGGVAVVPDGYPDTYPAFFPRPSIVTLVEGGHPLPSRGSVRGAQQALEEAGAATEDELLLALISGGGTALSSLPREDLELADLKYTYQQLLTGGVGIYEANTVRKHLTRVGGGQLAQCAQPAEVASLIVSDVVGDDVSVIASGPTAADSSTYEDAIRVLYRHDLWHDVPAPVRTHLSEGARGRRSETPGPDAECFDRTTNTLLGTNRTALDAARAEAEARGYEVAVVQDGVEGEARDVGRGHAERMIDAAPSDQTCWLWGGETTVRVTGEGTGGRNQEVALGGALGLEEATDPAVLLSGGTDGIDGPTDAAGGWATPKTYRAAREAGCNPEKHLEENNSYPVFDTLNQLIYTGPTHTNVMDIQIGLVDPS